MTDAVASLRAATTQVRRTFSAALLGYAALAVGAVLLCASLVLPAVDHAPRTSEVVTVQPRIEVRAKFASLAPNGQTTGLAVASDGSLAVVDRSRQVVVRLDATGQPVAEWGPRFESDADAKDLGGITAVGSSWYLLDRGRMRILRLDSSGHAVGVIDLQSLGTYGPNGLAADALGNVYLADTGGNRILTFSPGGALLQTIGTAGAGLGQLKQPMGVAFAPDGAMYVADFENSRVERWDAQLQPTNSWPLAVHAWGVTADRMGRVYVTDADRKTVLMYGPQGDQLAEIGGSRGADLGINFPTQLSPTPDGAGLWVLGSDGLAYIDLSPYGNLVPTPVSRSTAPTLPLAVSGVALLAVGGASLRRRPARSAGVPVVTPAQTPLPRAIPRRAEKLTSRSRALLVSGSALAGAGLVGAALSQFSLLTPAARNAPWFGMAVLLLSALAWAAGCIISARGVPFAWVSEWPRSAESTFAPTLTRGRVIAASAAIVLALVAAGMWWTGKFETLEASQAALLWAIALVLLGVATATHTWRRPSLVSLVPVVLFVVALVPRIWQVADLPLGVWYDEAQGALEIRRVVAQGTYTPILNTYGRDTSGFFYLMPVLATLLGDNIATARTAAALVGAITTSITYLFARELFGWRVGLGAGALLVFERWHLNFSRLGFNPISLPMCATLAFWLLARALRRRSWTDMVWAGLALGLGMHAYTGYRGTAIVVLLSLLYYAVIARWSPLSFLSRAGAYVGGFAICALPVLIFAIQDPVTYNGRTAQTLILTQPVSDAEKIRQIWDTIQRHALMFNVTGDMNGRHNLPGAPMLDAGSAVLVVLGLGWMILHLRQWRAGALLAWSAVSLSGGILTLAFEAPQGARTIGITPVLAVLAAVGLIASLDRLVALASLARAVHPGRLRIAAAGVATLTLVIIGYVNLDTFFNRQMANSDVFAAFSTRETIPVRAALQERGNFESILASTTMTPSVQAAYMTPDQVLLEKMRQFDPTGDLPYRGGGPALVFLETEHDKALADAVARMYPEVVPMLYSAPDGGPPIVEGFRLSPDVLAAHHGAVQTGSGWSTMLALDTSGEYAFRVPTGVDLRVDDVPQPDATAGGVRLLLARGNHTLSVSSSGQAPALSGLEWRTPANAEWQPIPSEALFAPQPGGTGLQLTLTAGTVTDTAVDPVLSHYYHVSPFSRLHIDPPQWTADWTGLLDVPDQGTYAFSLDHSQTAGVWLDDRQILGNYDAPSDTRNSLLQLTPGRHSIRIHYEKSVEGSPWINLFWTPPGGQSTVVPSSALFPPPPQPLGP